VYEHLEAVVPKMPEAPPPATTSPSGQVDAPPVEDGMDVEGDAEGYSTGLSVPDAIYVERYRTSFCKF
jgi:hypothetical protein